MEPLRENVSSHKHFILDGFSELGALRPVLFVPFFIMFVVSLSANSLLLYVVISQRSLHSPMCILIAGMAFVDLSLPLFFVPNMLLSFLFDWRGISLIGCLVQMHFIQTIMDETCWNRHETLLPHSRPYNVGFVSFIASIGKLN